MSVDECFDVAYLVLSGTTTAARCPELLRGLVGLGFSTVIALPTPNAARVVAPRELADVEGVAEVYSVAGEADIVAVVRVRHHDDLADVVTRRITALDGIVNTRTLIAFQAFSRKDLEALWDLGAEGV